MSSDERRKLLLSPKRKSPMKSMKKPVSWKAKKVKLSSPFIELLTQFLILDSTSEMHTKKVL